MKIIKGFLQHIVSRPIWIIGGFAVLSLTFASQPAFAAIGESLGAFGGGLLKSLFGGIFAIIGSLAAGLSNLFVLIINTVILPGQNSLFFGSDEKVLVVKQVFDSMLGIANILFFITLVVFAIMIITRQSGYNFKKAITALITAIVLANISYPLVQVLIEIGDSLRNTGTALFGGSIDAGAWADWTQSLVATYNVDFIWDHNVKIGPFILVTFAAMATQVIMAFVFFRLMAVLVERAIRLVALTIFAPIQAVLGIFPQKDLQVGGNWISDIIKWVLVLPVVFILIGIAKAVMPPDTHEALTAVLQNLSPDQAGGSATHITNAGLLFQVILGLGVMWSATNVPALLKVPISAATKFMTDSLNGGGFIGKPLKKIASTQGALLGNQFNNSKLGRYTTAPISNLLTKGAIKQEAADKRLKAIRGAKEVSQTSQANAINLKAGLETKKQHDAARDAWYQNNQYGDAETWDDLKEPEKEMMLRKFHQENPRWKQRSDSAKKMRITANLDDINPVAEADLGIENLSKFTKTALEGMEKEGANPTDLAKGGVRGNFGALDRLAHRAGKNYDPARKEINDILFARDGAGNYIVDAKGKYTKTKYHQMLKDSGYEWTPSEPYKMADTKNARTTTVATDTGTATSVGPSVTGIGPANSNAVTDTPRPDLLTQQNQAEAELKQAEATRTDFGKEALTTQLMQTATPSQSSNMPDSTNKLNSDTPNKAVEQLVDSIDGLLQSLGTNDIAKARDALVSSLSPAQQTNLTNENIQRAISDVLNSDRTDTDKTGLINEILASKSGSSEAIDPQNTTTLGSKLAEGLVKHEFNLADITKIKAITDQANQIGGEAAIGIVNSRLSQPSITTIEQTITEKTKEVNTIQETINSQAVADPAIQALGTNIIAKLDPTALDDLVDSLEETSAVIKSTVTGPVTGETKFSQLSPDAMQTLMTKLDQAAAKVGLPTTSLVGIDQNKSLTQINNNIVGMLNLARTQQKNPPKL